MKFIIFFMQFFLIASCQEKKEKTIEKVVRKNINCKEIVTSFNYPSDIELLKDKKYICDSTIIDKLKFNSSQNDLKVYNNCKLIFSDKNYTLIEYDLRTRILNDKRNQLWLVFKAGEAGNFYFNNPKYKNIYGLSKIYILDDKLLPLYSFNNSRLRKYRLNKSIEITESIEIILSNKQISQDIDKMDYNGILQLVNELKNNKYSQKSNWIEENYYINPPVWTDL
jgi:hypothetical protein